MCTALHDLEDAAVVRFLLSTTSLNLSKMEPVHFRGVFHPWCMVNSPHCARVWAYAYAKFVSGKGFLDETETKSSSEKNWALCTLRHGPAFCGGEATECISIFDHSRDRIRNEKLPAKLQLESDSKNHHCQSKNGQYHRPVFLSITYNCMNTMCA